MQPSSQQLPRLVAEIIGYYQFNYRIKRVNKQVKQRYYNKLVSKIPKLHVYVEYPVEQLEFIISRMSKYDPLSDFSC